jgi:CP family cyanate transporter-like MFS transporter
MFTARTTDGHAAAALSGFAQGIGYLIASAGPLLLGFLHAATGGWTVPATALLGVAVAQLAVGVQGGRALTISAVKDAGQPVIQQGAQGGRSPGPTQPAR